MSRGGLGRGGFRGGMRGVESRLGLEFEDELGNLANTKPAEKFPKIDVPIPPVSTDHERLCVRNYRTLRARIHDGPFYCIIDPSTRISKRGGSNDNNNNNSSSSSSSGTNGRPVRTPATALFDPFEEQPTYGQRFKRTRLRLPNLHKRPFCQEFFPRELWSTIGVGVEGPRTAKISMAQEIDRWAEQAEKEGGGEEEGAGEEAGEEAVVVGDEDGEGREEGGEEEDGEAKDSDQFESDEEDEDDDYNAEQYFEGGEEDDYGDEGGGGGADDYD